jgi:hypothetical protein
MTRVVVAFALGWVVSAAACGGSSAPPAGTSTPYRVASTTSGPGLSLIDMLETAPVRTSTPTPATNSAPAPPPAQVGDEPSFPPSSLNCVFDHDVVSCYDPEVGNIYCSGEGLLYCQSPRGVFYCQTNGRVQESVDVTLRCFS